MILVNRTNKKLMGKERFQPTNVNLCNRIRYKTFMVSFLNREIEMDSVSYAIPSDK